MSDRTENRFLQHVMGHLRPGGRAVIALPERTLFDHESTALWKELLEEYRLDGVVRLPTGTFEPYTGIAMSLVVFCRAEPRDTVRDAVISPTAWDAAVADVSVGAGGESESDFPTGRRFDDALLRAISDAIGGRGELPAGTLSPGVEVWDAPLDEVAVHYSQQVVKSLSAQMLDMSIDQIVAADPSLAVERLRTVAEILNPYEDLEYDEGFLQPGDLLVPISNYDGEIDADITIIGDLMRIKNHYESLFDPDWRIVLLRVHDGIKPQFLAAILDSPTYRHWLHSHAVEPSTGGFTGALDTLRIPVPPPAVQDAVLDELDGPSADALAVLHRLLAEVSEHPVAFWLETSLPARLAAGGVGVGAGDGMRTLAEIGQGLGALRQSAGSAKGNRLLDEWLSAARRAAAALDGVDSIPPGAGRLAILEFALVRLHQSMATLRGAEGAVIERLRSVTRALVDLGEQEVYAMQQSITLDIDVEPVEVVAGDTSEVVIRATNASAVPLRNVKVTARRPDGTIEEKAADYVAERGTHDLPIAVRPTGEERSLQIAVEWQARRFDGKPVRGDGAVSSAGA